MAYLGTSPSNGVRRRFIYTATANQTSFSGNDDNGTSLVYVDVAYLDVYQNGVKLKSVSDYASTTGTSVVLVQGASADDVVEIIAFDVFSIGDTVSAADGGSFGGNIGIGGTLSVTGNVVSPITLGGTTPTLTIGDAGAEDAKIVFDGNAQDYHIGLDDSADTLTIGKGSALGTTTAMSFDANGIITKPLQPAFLATKSGAQNNIGLNSVTQITFDGERFDQNGDFSSSTFTAPVTGKYQFNVVTTLANTDQDADYIEFKLVTSNVTYTNPIIDPAGFDIDLPFFTISTSYLVDMDANDTAKASLYQPNGAAQMDVRAGQSFFSGYLVA